MDSILQQITDWLKEMLVEAIMGNLSGLFDSVNNQVGEIASDVGMTPANFSPGVFAMIRNISENVIIPIAGLILTFIVCHELIQLIIDHNNLANFETWIFFKWVFKTFVAVMLITNTCTIYSDGDLSVVMDTDGSITFTNTAHNLNAVTVGRLFDRFYTVEASRNSSGLGLSIAKLLVERMGGTISAQYADNKLNIVIKI